jgi:hypothetical protein
VHATGTDILSRWRDTEYEKRLERVEDPSSTASGGEEGEDVGAGKGKGFA